MNSRLMVTVMLLGAVVTFGQVPVITSVSDLRGNPVICPSSVAQVFGTWPVDGTRNWTATVGGLPGIVSLSWIVKNVAVELDVVVPAGVPVGNSTLVVSHLGVASNAFPVTIVAVDPVLDFGAYTAFAHLTGVAITPTAPAAPGETVTTFMTGLGATNPVVAIGTPITDFIPTAQTTTVTVAGEAAPVRFAGYYPGGKAGSDQVSFDLPADIASGPQPVVVSIGGVTSNPEILFVGTQALPLGQPVVSAVVNGASFANQSTISPGSFISIFASNLPGPDNPSAFPNTTVNGVSVQVNGKPAPIFGLFASIGQINALVPADADIGASLQIVVQNQNGPSKPGAYFGGAAGPGIFLVPDPGASARTNAAATLANSAWLVIPATQAKALGLPACTGLSATASCGQPAHAGDYVQLYVTGLGRATPNGDPTGSVLPTGQVAPLSGKPIYSTVATPVVTVGGVAAKVLFSGLAPGFAGLYQVDFQLPGNAAPGDNVALQISVPGSATASATIAIQ
jgi:uncharacterized protein (TIGR03437 family)